jgi:hypothetical protein
MYVLPQMQTPYFAEHGRPTANSDAGFLLPQTLLFDLTMILQT